MGEGNFWFVVFFSSTFSLISLFFFFFNPALSYLFTAEVATVRIMGYC